MTRADELQQQICDLFWSLLEPWDEKIAEHDDQLHLLLKELREEEQLHGRLKDALRGSPSLRELQRRMEPKPLSAEQMWTRY